MGKETIGAREPFNVEKWSYALNNLAQYAYTYIPGLDEKEAYNAFEKILYNKTRKVFSRNELKYWFPYLRKGRIIIKDATAAMSSEWLYKNFDLNVLITVRHPAAYVTSLLRVNWDFPFENLLNQKTLMERELFPLKEEMENIGNNFIDKAALSWKCIYYVLTNYIRRNDWLYKRHEDLSRNPVDEFEDLYNVLGLQWDDEVRQKILQYTGSSNPVSAEAGVVHQLKRDSRSLVNLWKEKLTPDQIKRIKEITDPISSIYYDDSEW